MRCVIDGQLGSSNNGSMGRVAACDSSSGRVENVWLPRDVTVSGGATTLRGDCEILIPRARSVDEQKPFWMKRLLISFDVQGVKPVKSEGNSLC